MNTPSIASKRIMLTGGAGFLGSFVTEKLKARGCTQIFIPKEQDYDLTKSSAIEAAFKAAGNLFSSSPDPRPPTPDSRPPVDVVIHLAAKVGGIGANRENPGSSHVIPNWGTGKATREFLYVEDCAEAIVLATEKYNAPEPVNIGAGFEISIKDLVELIARLTGFKGNLIWDAACPAIC